MRMYVWTPPSLEDYSSGMVCVIAESKPAAILLAVDERFPYFTKKQYKQMKTPLTLEQLNENMRPDRDAFRAELKRLKPRVITRGAVHIHGGG